MLIERYDLEVFTPPCSPGDERFSAIAHTSVDIRAVLPYLNATLRGAAYSQAAQALSWRKAGHYVVFHPNRIAVSNVEDRQSAIGEIAGLVKPVNRTQASKQFGRDSHYGAKSIPSGADMLGHPKRMIWKTPSRRNAGFAS